FKETREDNLCGALAAIGGISSHRARYSRPLRPRRGLACPRPTAITPAYGSALTALTTARAGPLSLLTATRCRTTTPFWTPGFCLDTLLVQARTTRATVLLFLFVFILLFALVASTRRLIQLRRTSLHCCHRQFSHPDVF